MIPHIIRGAACAAALGFAATGAANAQAREDGGFYIQGGYSWLNLEADNTGSDVDAEAITARLGWQFGPTFGIEADISAGLEDGDFDFDSTEEDFDLDDNNDGDFSDAINLAGDIGVDYLVAAYFRGVLPVSDSLELSARVGYAFIEVDSNIVTPGGSQLTIFEDSADGFSAGAGITYDLTENLELRGDYTWYGFDDVDATGATVTIGYKF
jgi:outer membrane immunogenic protein